MPSHSSPSDDDPIAEFMHVAVKLSQDDALVATQLKVPRDCVVRPIEVRGEQHSAGLRKRQPVRPRTEIERHQQPGACMAPHVGEDITVGRHRPPIADVSSAFCRRSSIRRR